MATLPDINITKDDYVSVNSLSGIPVGTAIILQIKGSGSIIINESPSKPLSNVLDGTILTSIDKNYAQLEVTTGSDEVWAIANGRDSRLTVQEV